MKNVALVCLVSALSLSGGCSDNKPAPANNAGGVQVTAPNVDVKSDANGVQVKAPGVDVNTERK
jgi:hypothetical protein